MLFLRSNKYVTILSTLQVYQELERLQLLLFGKSSASLQLPPQPPHTPQEDYYSSKPLNEPEESDESLEGYSKLLSDRSGARESVSMGQLGTIFCRHLFLPLHSEALPDRMIKPAKQITGSHKRVGFTQDDKPNVSRQHYISSRPCGGK